MSLALFEISDPSDPRVDSYRDLKDRPMSPESGRFVAESERVVRILWNSTLAIHSMLLTPTRLATLRPLLDELVHRPDRKDIPIYVGTPKLLEGVAGFPIHRGCLAIAERPRDAAIPQDAKLLVVLEDLVDVDNVGSIVRSAAGFGADAVILSPRCADPYYRKAVRTSAGCALTVPIVRLRDWPGDLAALGRDFTLVGMTPQGAEPLAQLPKVEKVALLLGSEGDGLSAEALALCHRRVAIPMAPAADSLNVSVSTAVALYHMAQVAKPPHTM